MKIRRQNKLRKALRAFVKIVLPLYGNSRFKWYTFSRTAWRTGSHGSNTSAQFIESTEATKKPRNSLSHVLVTWRQNVNNMNQNNQWSSFMDPTLIFQCFITWLESSTVGLNTWTSLIQIKVDTSLILIIHWIIQCCSKYSKTLNKIKQPQTTKTIQSKQIKWMADSY